MEFEDFHESMFLFVDVWCDGISTAQYNQFAVELLQSLINQTWFTSPSFGLSSDRLDPAPRAQTVEEYLAESAVRVASISATAIPLDTYSNACRHFAVPMSKVVCAKLGECPRHGSMKKLEISKAGLTSVLPLLDILALNRELVHLDVSRNGLDSQSLELLFRVLLWHPHLTTLDISHNPGVCSRTVAALYQLLCRSTQLGQVACDGTVPRCYEPCVQRQVEFNVHSQTIGREQYHLMRKAFRDIDVADEGHIELQALLDWFAAQRVMGHLRARKKQQSAAEVCLRADAWA